MKKYRCPHCGCKSISTKLRIQDSLIFGGAYHGSGKDAHICCPACNGMSRPSPMTAVALIFRIALLILTIASIVASYFLLKTIPGAKSWMLILLALAILAVYAVIVVITDLSFPLIPKAFGQEQYEDSMKTNTVVELNGSKYIKPYGVYGLKFKTETTDEKFREAFPDGLVPAVFHPNAKGSLTYDVRIINKAAVPDDVLFDGAKFLVEDHDGIFITQGTVEKSIF